MFFVHSIHSISHQESFLSTDLNSKLMPISENSALISPDYKTYISPVALRRLSPVLRMGIAAAKECEKAVNKPFDAISVGTALGCLTDTEKFLKVINTVEGDVLSPTAFIQSTHNTIAGQISLDLGNHAYNMTHTQNNLSFEMALLDGLLCCAEGAENVLVGAADEAIDYLENLKPILFSENVHFTSGATFLVVGPKRESDCIQIVDCSTIFDGADLVKNIVEFLKKHHLELTDLAKIYSNLEFEMDVEIENYETFSGKYLSSSAFGFHMAHDWLVQNHGKTVLIVNADCNGNLGLILLKNDQTQV